MSESKNPFLDKKLQKKHLNEVLSKAGKSYFEELNVNLPISKFFDAVCRNENFNNEVNDYFNQLKSSFNRIHIEKLQKVQPQITNKPKSTATTLDQSRTDIEKLEDLDPELKSIRKNLEENFRLLEKLFPSEVSSYTKDLWSKIDELAVEVEEIASTLSSRVKQHVGIDKHSFEEYYAGYIYDFMTQVWELSNFMLGTEVLLSNFPYLLLEGEAGVGKTHSLVHLAKSRIENKLPTAFIFGKDLKGSGDYIESISSMLKLDETRFLSKLNRAGEEMNSRTLLIIDALDEANKEFRRSNLKTLVNEVKKYKNIALIVSLKSNYKATILPDGCEIEDNLSDIGEEKLFVPVKHGGLGLKTWDVMKRFFSHYKVPLPEIPLLAEPFSNPRFLYLFCKSEIKKDKKGKAHLIRGHQGATKIFEDFIEGAFEKLVEKYKQRGIDLKENFWNNTIKEISKSMFKNIESGNNGDVILESELVSIIEKEYPEVNPSEFVKDIEAEFLLKRIFNSSNENSGCYFRLPFPEFSNHLVARYILKKYYKEYKKEEKKRGQTIGKIEFAKSFFAKETKIGKFLLGNPKMVVTLSTRSPEHFEGVDFRKIAPYIDGSILRNAFIDSLIWRNPKAFPKKSSQNCKEVLSYLEEEIFADSEPEQRSYYYQALSALITVSVIPEHPLNSEFGFLHRHLEKLTMPERDDVWAKFLYHNSFLDDQERNKRNNAIDRLIEWCLQENVDQQMNDKSIFLTSITLAWMLSTTGSTLRDKATEGLVAILTNRLGKLKDLLELFKDIDDMYILERLYAVAYGCAMRSRNKRNLSKSKKELEELSLWVYKNIFEGGNPPKHILIRDYARGVIEVALDEKIDLDIEESKIKPPFNSDWPEIPSVKELEKKYAQSENGDIFGQVYSSVVRMRSSHVVSSSPSFADFSKDIVGPCVTKWNNVTRLSGEEVKELDLFQIAEGYIVNRVMELGLNGKLHGEFDKNKSDYRDLPRKKATERIGKKYQWIALYEFLAMLSDNFRFGVKCDSLEEVSPFEGAYQLGMPRIDPSFVLIKPSTKGSQQVSKIASSVSKFLEELYDIEKTKKYPDNRKWIEDHNDFPAPELLMSSASGDYILLNGLKKWDYETKGPSNWENKIYTKNLLHIVQSCLVKKSDLVSEVMESFISIMKNQVKEQDIRGIDIPDCTQISSSHCFLGEYLWSSVYKSTYSELCNWQYFGKEDTKNKIEILNTCNDYSVDDSDFRIKLPLELIVEELDLSQDYTDGRFFDKDEKLIAFDSGIFNQNIKEESLLFMKKDSLCNWLEDEGYGIVWVIRTEKIAYPWKFGKGDVLRSGIDGIYKLDEKRELSGKKFFTYLSDSESWIGREI